MKKSLNGLWKFRKLNSGQYKNANVPGCNFLDLMENGDLDDPFYALNEKKADWVGKEDWEYIKEFELSEQEFTSDDIVIQFNMLDTICDVFINGHLLFKGDNCFVAYNYSVKDYLKTGNNEIKVIFYSPVKYVEQEYKKVPTPMNSNGQNGIVHIRKPQSHFGWDWGPVLPPSGISGDVYLDFIHKGKIDFLSVTQNHNEHVVVNVNADLILYDDVDCTITLESPDGEVVCKQGASAEFIVENPELWWTYELSSKDIQPLYTVKAQLEYNGKVIDTAEKKIGLRTIELNRDRDAYGQNFQFVLNGVPLFIKGASYIPPDSFITRFDSERLTQLLDAARFSNMNMIRIWGGGYYESDDFYNACDERGILVWQDFQFACQAYPFFLDSFLDNVKKEVAYNVKRLCHHPSLAVWCGNNEIEDMHMAWAHMKKYVDWTEKFFYHILEPEVRKFDVSTPYTQGSPIGVSHNQGVFSDNVGDTHLWGVWHGLQPMNYYRKRMTRFCSEFGFESLPDLKTIESFAQPEDYFLSSEVFKSHQKCANGNDKMIYYIASRFNLPARFEDYIYLSQVTQQECIADATEHWRRHKGRCNGSMYWQFNDCWGVCSWSSFDYYGNYKALQYKAKHFNAPLSVSVEDTEEYINIFALNDLNSDQKLTVEYEIFDFVSGTLEKESKEINLDKVSNVQVFSLNVKDIKSKYDYKQTAIASRLYQDGKLLMQKVTLFNKEKNLNLPKAKLKTKITMFDNHIEIRVHSDKYARFVKIESSKSVLPMSDNFFDLLPGETKTIIMKKDKNMTIEDLAQSISVYSLCNIKPDNNKLKTLLKQVKVFCSPINIGNAIHHGKLSKDVQF